MPADNAITSTSQQYLDIFDITNDMVLMKDGSVSTIISVSALNFGLLAEEEQDAIIYSYAGLLNSLNYPIQIIIRSQTKDVTGYLSLLEEQIEKSPEKQLKERISRYRNFVSNLIQERNVLDKKFYVVIPASPIELGILSAQSVIPGVKSTAVEQIDRSVILEKARNTLEPKRDHLVGQFGRIGLYARQLQTQEIIQLFYVSYNPEAGEGQQLTDSTNYTTPLVQARIQSGPGELMADLAQTTTTVAPADTVNETTTTTTTAMPMAPAAMASTPMTPAEPAPVQSEIDSTLSAMGQSTAAAPAETMATPATPSMMNTSNPMASTPSSSMPSMDSSMSSMPATSSEPMAMPSMVSTTTTTTAPVVPASSDTSAPAETPAELPEI